MDQLPPETQTGANTFGCLIDGKVFIPKGDPFGGAIIKAAYQFVNGRNSLLLSGRRSSAVNNGSSTYVGLYGDSLFINVGTYSLLSEGTEGLFRFYGVYSQGNIDYYTNQINRGQLTIKRFDTVNHIISGTFWFDAKNNEGTKIEVRDGRFDLPYVR